MTIFTIELYDKDNDIYEPLAYSSDAKELMLRGRLIEYLVKKDTIRCCYSERQNADSGFQRKICKDTRRRSSVYP